ncbi:hypothetical protein ACMZOO_10990 [Catenovulum sp. SX2]|uniref:hypothetical protein n=1 Tax=Catenovulum sp. SX2 TaxID=3398614 RepID=UPI003F8362EC
MKNILLSIVGACAVSALVACQTTDSGSENVSAELGKIAPKPLYRDSIYDGAADPLVMFNHTTQKWNMLYTNRRANAKDVNGVEWVHGTPIGIAESDDGGATWQYKADANIQYPYVKEGELATFWAPDVFYQAEEKRYHMYLTIVPGVFDNWRHPRSIAHFTSSNLLDWQYVSTLKLNTNKVIDADVVALPQGGYRMFYNDEPDGKSVYYADSKDLYTWEDKGKAKLQSRGEGPTTFYWQGYWWLVVDAWKGLAVYRSTDLENWQQQAEHLVQTPGTGKDDGVIGGHPDVVVNNDRAYLFYFTHPGRTAENKGKDNYQTRRSSIQVSELEFVDGWLTTDRNKPTRIDLR